VEEPVELTLVRPDDKERNAGDAVRVQRPDALCAVGGRIDEIVRQMEPDRRLLAGIERNAGVGVAGRVLDLEAQALLMVGETFKVGCEVARGREVEGCLSRRRQEAKARGVFGAGTAQYDRAARLILREGHLAGRPCRRSGKQDDNSGKRPHHVRPPAVLT